MNTDSALLLRSFLRKPTVIGVAEMDPHTYGPANERRDVLPLPDPGMCTGMSANTIFIFDDSLSVTGGFGSDPLSRRYYEAKRAVDHISRSCTCGRERITVLHFDHSRRTATAPQQLSRRGLWRLYAALHAPDGPGSSALEPALAAAEQFAQRPIDSPVALTVFSDFLLTDGAPGNVLERLITFPGQVHAVLLEGRPPQCLIEAPHVKTSVITRDSTPGAVAQIIVDSLSMHRNPLS